MNALWDRLERDLYEQLAAMPAPHSHGPQDDTERRERLREATPFPALTGHEGHSL